MSEQPKPGQLCAACARARAVEHYHNIPAKYCPRCKDLQERAVAAEKAASNTVTLTTDDLVRKLIELAAMHLSLRESHAMAVAALKDPDKTARLLNLRFKGQTLTEAEMVDLLRSLKHELQTMGSA